MKRLMTRLVLLWSVSALHLTAEPLDIHWLVDSSLAHSARLQAVEFAILQEEVELDIAHDLRLPTVSGSIDYSSGDENRQQLKISQTLYDWGTTSGKINAAKIEADLIKLEYERVRDEEVEDIVLLVLERGASLARRNVIEMHIARLNKLRDITSLRIGTVTDRGELSRVTATIAGAQIDLARTEAELYESSVQIYERIKQEVPLDDITELPVFRLWFEQGLSIEQLLSFIQTSPLVLEADLNVAKAEIEAELAAVEWRPTLSLDAVAERTEGRFGTNTDERIVLSIKTPVLQGLSAFKKPKSAGHALTAAIRERDRNVSDVRRAVQRLINSLNLQDNREPLIKRQIESSQSTVALYTQQFGIGRRDMSDLIGAEVEQLNAELSQIDLYLEQQRLALRMASVLGLLMQNMTELKEGQI